jgi:hypothetical protein
MLSAADVLFHHIAGWKFERNGSSLLFSQGYSFLQVSFRRCTAPTGMPASAEIARTLMQAASSGAILARLVSCLLRALGDANCALSVLMRNDIAKIQLVPERRTRASGLAVI